MERARLEIAPENLIVPPAQLTTVLEMALHCAAVVACGRALFVVAVERRSRENRLDLRLYISGQVENVELFREQIEESPTLDLTWFATVD